MKKKSNQPTNEDAAEKTRKLLVQLSDIRSRKEMLQLEKEHALPQEVRKIIADINEEYGPREEVIAKQEKEVEEAVKKLCIEAGGTVKGLRLQAVYTEPKPVWDGSKLEGYAASHPEILKLREMSEAKVSIRAVSTKE